MIQVKGGTEVYYLSSKNMLDPLRKCTQDIWGKGQRYKVPDFWVADAKAMYFDLSEGEPVNYCVNATVKGEV